MKDAMEMLRGLKNSELFLETKVESYLRSIDAPLYLCYGQDSPVFAGAENQWIIKVHLAFDVQNFTNHVSECGYMSVVEAQIPSKFDPDLTVYMALVTKAVYNLVEEITRKMNEDLRL